MSEIDRTVEALLRRVEALEDEAARPRQATAQRSSAPFSGSRRQLLLGGAGAVGALAGVALLGHAEPGYAAAADSGAAPSVSAPDGPTLHLPEKHLSLQTTLVPLKTRGVLWANHEWDFGTHFTGEQPPVVVATALDNYMEHDVAAFCVCAVAVHGAPGAYRATIMVRNISAYATSVVVSAVAFGV